MRILIEAANDAVAIEDGWIVDRSGSFETVVRIRDGEVRAGLMNAHDHLHRNHYGRLGAPPYGNAYEWARDIQCRHAEEIRFGRQWQRRDALLFGAWKNLLAGVTRVVHHDTWEPEFDKAFPITVIKLASADSLGMASGLPLPSGAPFALHVAEGVDVAAADEVRILDRQGFLTSSFLAVHAVGADDDGVQRLRRAGCAIVWCPSSNEFLFGQSAPAPLLAEGMDVLLGTDSLLTGAGTMLGELRAARFRISDARILDAIGPLAARRLGQAEPTITVGSRADLVVSRRPILDARLDDVILVMANGILRVLSPEFARLVRPRGGRILEAFGVRRWINDGPG
jgi:hypothetical protein